MQTTTAASHANISIPCITSLIRGDFTLLMQSLERNECSVSKTYILELALTLIRFDPHLREEECRAFVHAFDSLARRLLGELRRFNEVESLLREDFHLLTELSERCHTLDQLWGRYSVGKEGEAKKTTDASESFTPSVTIEVPRPPFTTPSKRKNCQDTCSPTETCADSCSSSDVKLVPPGDLSVITNTGGQEETVGRLDDCSEVVRNCAPYSPRGKQLFPEDPLQSSGNEAVRRQQYVEEFLELLTGRLSRDDAAIIVQILGSKPTKYSGKTTGAKRQMSSVTHDEPVYSVSGKSSHAGSKGNIANSNGNISRLGSHVSLVDSLNLRRGGYSVEDNESMTRVDNGSFNAESSAPSSFSASATPIRSMNKIALYLSVFADMLASGETCVARSLQSTLTRFGDGQQEDQAGDRSTSGNCFREGSNKGNSPMPSGLFPSQKAVNFLSVLFPSLRGYFRDFSWRADNVASDEGGANVVPSGLPHDCLSRKAGNTVRPNAFSAVGGSSNYAGIATLGDNANENEQTGGTGIAFSSGSSNGLYPGDIALFSLLRSLQKGGCIGPAVSADFTSGINDEGKEEEKTSVIDDSGRATLQQYGDGDGSTIIYCVWVELQAMSKEVHSGVFAAQAMREQIQEEITLLCFRVVTVILELLIPAASSVDQRQVLFFRKWVCDIYRLLLEEELLGRFSALAGASSSAHFTEVVNPDSCAPSTLPPTTPQYRKKRASGKGTPVTITRRGSLTCVLVDDGNGTLQNDSGPPTLKEEIGGLLVPGTAYSRLACSLDKSSARAVEGGSSGTAATDGRLAFIQTPAAPSYPAAHFGHGHYYRRDDPAVVMAESLFDDAPTEPLPQCHFVITRLMAMLLRGAGSVKTSNPVPAPDRGSCSVNGSFAGVSPNEFQTNLPRKPTPSVKPLRQTTRKKITVQGHTQVAASKKVQTSLTGVENKSTLNQRPLNRVAYPVVSCTGDVKALYLSVLCEVELMLSPLDPIRAATVQNAVDFLVSVTQTPGEAFELLDAYLDDVGMEQIQLPQAQRGVIDYVADGGAGSHGYSPLGSEPPSSLGSVRRQRVATLEAAASGGGRANAALRSCSVQQKRGGISAEKENSTSLLSMFPVIPTVIPSWNSPDESAQFMTILALLRHKHLTLQGAFGGRSSPPWLYPQGE